jgi:DHA1 family tetracycline resistance protein-like MFS transporter
MKNRHNAALGFIFVTLLLDCTGLGIIIPVMPRLIQDLTGGDLSIASEYGGWLTFAYAFMQFFFSPIMGGLSDRYGRRPVLLASIFGLGIDYLFLSFAPTIGWLFVGRVLAGIFGASFTTAGAYIADVSTPEKRAQNFGLMGAAFGLGFIIGPVIGGVFSQFGIRVPFLVAAAFSFLNWVYGFFIIPESLKPENRRKFEWKRANPVGSLLHVKRYPAIAGLIASIGLIYIAGHATQSTWTFFTMERFKWNEAWVGYSLGFVGLMVAIVQGGLIRVIIPKIGQKNAVYLGFLLYIIANVLFAFANQSWMMFAILIPYCLGGIAGPALQGIMSNEVPPNEQGELQGVFTALMSLTSIIGPLLMTGLFAYFTRPDAPVYFPGVPFLMAAILTTVSIILAARFLATHHIVAEKPQAEG